MPLVAVHKARRKLRRLEARGKRPHSVEQRRAWSIALQTEPSFRRAFSRLMSTLITDDDLREVRRALSEDGATVESVMQTIGFFDPDSEEARKKWEAFASRLEGAYEAAFQFAAQEEAKRHGWKTITKAKELPFIAIDPRAIEWMRSQSLARAVDLSRSEESRIRSILTRSFEAGDHPSAIVDEIQRTVGLTEAQQERVARRADAMFDAGYSDQEIKAESSRFSSQLRGQRAEAIARTESLEAQTEGLKATWRAAEDAGLVPSQTKKRWIATNDERTSEICLELHDQEVLVGEQFDSSIVGPIDGPPAHPNCRSTMILVFPED